MKGSDGIRATRGIIDVTMTTTLVTMTTTLVTMITTLVTMTTTLVTMATTLVTMTTTNRVQELDSGRMIRVVRCIPIWSNYPIF